jgi:hypothetical protein
MHFSPNRPRTQHRAAASSSPPPFPPCRSPLPSPAPQPAFPLPFPAPTHHPGQGGMFSGEWTPSCGSCCTKKYATLMQIPCQCRRSCSPAIGFDSLIEINQGLFCFLPSILPGRLFCKKGCTRGWRHLGGV